MIKFFSKKLNKKGFTLAELLIVIAIIAILVAIAVPIFTSELNKAKVARDRANVRAVKAAAIAIILGDDDKPLVDGSGNALSWWAKAAFTGGDLSDVSVQVSEYSDSNGSNSEAGVIDYAKSVYVQIKGTDLSGKSVG